MKRKPIAQCLREGAKQCGPTAAPPVAGYYLALTSGGVTAYYVDPIVMIFVGKFGTGILSQIVAEHRLDTWTERRVWDPCHMADRITRMVNGGVFELHRRLGDLPRLDTAIRRLGYREQPAKFTSVFRAITFMHGAGQTPEQIADALEDSRL